MNEPDFKTYIGDSVYVKFDGYHFILTTENGPDDPRNQIALEPSVYRALVQWADRLKEHYANEKETP